MNHINSADRFAIYVMLLVLTTIVSVVAFGVQGNLSVTRDTNETREGIVVACAQAGPDADDCISEGEKLLSAP